MKKILLDLPEQVESERLILQMPTAGFGVKLLAAVEDGFEDYVRWLNWPTILPTAEELEIDCRKHHAEFILRKGIRYLIIEKHTHEVIGRCAFPSLQAHWVIPKFGISYFIRRSARQQGYASEAVKEMIKIGFEYLKARKLEIFCDDENLESKKIPEKLGFKLEYSQRGGWPRIDGRLALLHTYSLFSEQDSNVE